MTSEKRPGSGLDDDLTNALVRTRRFFDRAEVSPDLRALYKVGGRSRDIRLGNRPARRGWERIGC